MKYVRSSAAALDDFLVDLGGKGEIDGQPDAVEELLEAQEIGRPRGWVSG
jgi:hypothetical protein